VYDGGGEQEKKDWRLMRIYQFNLSAIQHIEPQRLGGHRDKSSAFDFIIGRRMFAI
jgi:hypothetical protein